GNVSVIVGRLYGANDKRRDAGFSIFYMGINLGAFIAPLICGYLGQRVNWHIGFAAAGVGMAIGVLQYVLGARYLGDAGLHPASGPINERLRQQTRTWGALTIALLVLIVAAIYYGLIPISAKQVADAAGFVLLATAIGLFGWMFFA